MRVSARVQLIEQPRQQDGAGAVDAIDTGEIDLNGPILRQTRLQFLHRAHHRRHIGQIEQTGGHQAGVVALTVDADGGERLLCPRRHGLTRVWR